MNKKSRNTMALKDIELERIYEGPLKDMAKRERKALLLSSFIGMAISIIGPTIEKLNPLGVEIPINKENLNHVNILLIGLIIYFIIMFIYYAIYDWQIYKKHLPALKDVLKFFQKPPHQQLEILYDNGYTANAGLEEVLGGNPESKSKIEGINPGFTRFLLNMRIVVDIFIPLIIGVIAIIIILILNWQK